MQGQELPVSVTPIEGVYDPSGVMLSVIVAIAAAYVAFSMVRRLLITEGIYRWYWYAGAALTLGIGIWTMHFIGMIALQLPFPVQYHKGLTLLSLLMAVTGSLIALYIVVIHARTWRGFALGTSLWAGAIAAMHFIGMAAMVMPARMSYDGKFVFLSVLVSVCAAALALYLLCREAKLDLVVPWKRLASAVAMGLSISSMHYLSMLGTTFIPDEDQGRLFSNSFNSGQLHWPLAFGVLLFLYLLLMLSSRGTPGEQQQGISGRLRLLVIGMVTVTGMSVGVLSVVEIDSILEQQANSKLQQELIEQSEQFSELIVQMEEDIRFVAKVPGIKVLLKLMGAESSETAILDPAVVRRRVASLFKDYLSVKPEYLQLRLIGRADQGRELIRAEWRGNQVMLISDQALQQKASESYYHETLALLPGVPFLSDVNFNREHGVIAEPRTLVMRIALPIYLEGQDLSVGLVVINVNLNRVLKDLMKSQQPGDRGFLTDQSGRLLAYRDATVQVTDQGDQFIQTRYPFLAELYQRIPAGGQYNGKLYDGGEQLYVHVQKILISERYPDRELVMVEIVPVAYIEQQLRPVLNQAFITTLLLILLSIPIALWLVRQIVSPLSKLMRAMELFAGGDKQVDFPASKLHEIDLLSTTFNEMRQEVTSRELALAEAEARIRDVVENIAEGIITIDDQGHILSLNGAAEKIFGYMDKEIVGENVTILMPEPHRLNHNGYLQRFREGRGGEHIGVSRELKGQHKDGHIFPMEITITVAKQGSEHIFIGLIRDNTERQLARQQERLASKVMETSLESIAITDAKNRIEYVNPAFCDISGYSLAEALGKNPSFLASGRHDGEFYKKMWESINKEGSWQGEIWDRRKDGTLYLKWLSITAIENSVGEITHYVGIASDITERKQSEERLKDLAHHDQLTGLPNRQLFNDRLEHALIQATRNHSKLALLFIDLDRFKGVNDTYGHDVGDKLLIEVADRIHQLVREGDTVARLGGDEFTLILPEINEAANAVRVAREVLDIILQPVIVDGHDCSVGASIGIAFFPDDAKNKNTLLRHADIAMYRAKSHSGSTYCLFDKEMEEEAARKVTIETRLRTAIEQEQFFLNYQPVIATQGGRPVGFEALIRWQVPGMGVIAPAEFIPLSEETGQIVEIGDWVLDRVCRQLADWRSLGLKLLPVAVNISTRQLLERDFVSHIKKLLERYQLDAESLELELTETTLMKYPEECQQVLESCQTLGLRIAIDDFGTGYSSLAYLKQLPINKLKIDRTFIEHLEEGPRSRAIVDSVVHLAQGLDIQVVAEGVETPGQLALLRELECSYLQGFLFSKPVSAEIAAEVLSDSRVYC